MFGFEKKPYFEAQKGAETAPKVEFLVAFIYSHLICYNLI